MSENKISKPDANPVVAAVLCWFVLNLGHLVINGQQKIHIHLDRYSHWYDPMLCARLASRVLSGSLPDSQSPEEW